MIRKRQILMVSIIYGGSVNDGDIHVRVPQSHLIPLNE